MAVSTKSAEAEAPQASAAPQTASPAAPANANVGANVVPLRRGAAGRAELEFLPAALEIVETPASPVGRAVGGALIVFFLMALAWACLGHVDIIATAQGRVVPVGRSKTVQPLESGIVTAIHVRDGDKVAAGQVLIELDRVVSTADRNRVAQDMMSARLDAARLTALRAGLDAGGITPVGFTPPEGAPSYDVARVRAAMTAQADQQAAKLASLDQQIAQKDAEADGIAAVVDKLEAGLPLLQETADIREKAKNLAWGNVIAHLDAQLKVGEQRHELIVQKRKAVEIAAARQAITFQRAQAMAEYTQGIMSDLAEAEQKAAQSGEDLVKAEKKMSDQVLRAPIDGVVQQLALHTVGGVVTPAQALMVIVPADSRIEIEAMVQNRDIGFVHEGDAAEVKIDTFNFTKYGLLHGTVVSMSGDAIQRDKAQGSDASGGGASDKAGASSRSSEPSGQELLYAARIALDASRIEVEGRMVDLAPGMAVTVEIKTGQRRIIEFLLSPLLRYKQESLRER
jgi:hemolysin D